ncbi:MAG TPA: lysozyme inhibitor LprI family protein [Chthoniobacterales bacterium]|nr:lysozyme inhibitor LprI family protein [Chthoniobacterales bacterium]
MGPRKSAVWFALATTVLARPATSAGGEFKRFPETISPDGAYVLAWGAGGEQAGDTAQFTEVPYENDDFDQANVDADVNNYLVETATNKIVATIPGFSYFAGPNLRKNRSGLNIAWTPDAQSGLGIFDGRWSSEAVVWIEPRTRKMVDVQEQLAKGFMTVLHKNEKRFKTVEVRFFGAVIPKPGVLVIRASGSIPKEDETADYALKFTITGAGDKVQFHLQSGRRLPEESRALPSDPEEELNRVYTKVRSSLSPRDRDTLRDEQTRWLKLREQIANDNSRERFTQHRIEELHSLEVSK